MNEADVEKFEKVHSQLHGLHAEMSALSKGKPNDAVNEFKLRLINTVLEEADALLDSNHLPFEEFKAFDKDAVPTNSDVMIVVSQYLKCLEQLRSESITNTYSNWYWIIDGKQSGKRTAPPAKLKGMS